MITSVLLYTGLQVIELKNKCVDIGGGADVTAGSSPVSPDQAE